jgi:hypothetical protein
MLFADYDAITDGDGALFTKELMDAYPEAKVILNYRKDLDKWHNSLAATFGAMESSWSEWFLSHFCFELFWAREFVWKEYLPLFFRGSWAENGKWVYREHIATVRGLVPKERLLEWTVDDGWEPLCKFLGKEVPTEEFPSGNTPAGFAQTVAKGHAERTQRALRNMGLTFGSVIVIAVAGYGRFLGTW